MSDFRLHILLVEDNPDHAELVLRSLEEIDPTLRVLHLSDGEQALDYLLRRSRFAKPVSSPRPHLVLLDLRLPRVDGLEVLKQIKTTEAIKAIPVVILTTSKAESDSAQAYEHHANSYLVKPEDFGTFAALMQAIRNYWLHLNLPPTPRRN